MARSDDENYKDRNLRKETKEEKLLRRAKEYVEQEELLKRKKNIRKEGKEDRDLTRRHSKRRYNSHRDSESDYYSSGKDDHREGKYKRKSRHRREGNVDRKRSRRCSKKFNEHDERSEFDDDSSEKDNYDKKLENISSKEQEHDRKRCKKRSQRRADREKKRKKHKNRSTESPKHHRKRNKNDNGEKENVKLLKIDQSKLYPLGDVLGQPPNKLLDPIEDYFAFHQHLWLYLHRQEGITFGDLASDEARKAFRKFVTKYNSGKLEKVYYSSVLPAEAMENNRTTRHRWKFQTSSTEQKSLHMIEEGVRKQTEYNESEAKSAERQDVINLKVDNKQLTCRPCAKTTEERIAERVANRRLREHVKAAEEELTGGRKEGHERVVEKRREQAHVIHGAARDREEAQIGIELRDSDIYGGDKDGFDVALKRERQRKQNRDNKKEARIKELQQKEQDRQVAMLKSLGLSGIKPGQKIKIRPRNDG